MSGKTLFDKIWDSHVVRSVQGGPDVLYIDRHYIHEVTSPQAFSGLRQRGIGVFRPERTIATADHNIPTVNQHQPIADLVSRSQVETLEENCRAAGITYFGMGDPGNGIVHVTGPEQGYTLPGMTIVCGDSHTSTHGAFGTIAFGIGTSEVEMVLATQCLLQARPKQMRINVKGKLHEGLTSKDLILYIIASLGTGGATGCFVEYAGEAVRKLSMESRMTVCNMSIEMGARGGLIAPDEVTFNWLAQIPAVSENPEFSHLIHQWHSLRSDRSAHFDSEVTFNASEIPPMITYGTSPGMGMAVNAIIPCPGEPGVSPGKKHPPSSEVGPAASPVNHSVNGSYFKSLEYMGFNPGMKLLGHPVDYVFLGSCTNGRIEDLRLFTAAVAGKKKAAGVTVLIVPGSQQVARQAEREGLTETLRLAGFEMRQPGCSSCLAMNEDKIPAGKYAVSTSNRNFEGRQGPGARTLLAGPLVAAAAAVTGKITDPRELIWD
ncbi:MAG: 3-isopropylmalate dehydratase large subunit [Bacteroidota bacterium]|nr:3-isopropylmalate dehydratase large subunit [Bacteroidota bacterium]